MAKRQDHHEIRAAGIRQLEEQLRLNPPRKRPAIEPKPDPTPKLDLTKLTLGEFPDPALADFGPRRILPRHRRARLSRLPRHLVLPLFDKADWATPGIGHNRPPPPGDESSPVACTGPIRPTPLGGGESVDLVVEATEVDDAAS